MQNTFLQNEALNIVDSDSPTVFKLTFNMTSSSDPSYNFSPVMIGALEIDELYQKNIGDSILIHFKISDADYIELYERRHDLSGILTLEYCDNTGTSLSPPKISVKYYTVVLINPEDQTRNKVDAHLRIEFDGTIKLRLIETELYHLRHAKINTIYVGVTIKEVIKHATATFGIEDLYLVEPDNKYTYSHFCIPPMKSFSEFYEWLQTEYGVYMEGITTYYRDKKLYVYPPYDNKSNKFPFSLIVIQTDKGEYAGAACNHMFSDKSLYVVTGEIVDMDDRAMIRADNVGTDISFYRSGESLDGTISVDPDDKQTVNFNPATGVTIGLNKTQLVKGKVKNTQYVGTIDNPFILASNLSAEDSLRISFSWVKAVPFAMFPGMRVSYLSDNRGILIKRSGILDSISYKIFPISQAVGNGLQLFTSIAHVVVNLNPYSETSTSGSDTSTKNTGSDSSKQVILS